MILFKHKEIMVRLLLTNCINQDYINLCHFDISIAFDNTSKLVFGYFLRQLILICGRRL